MSFCSQAQNLVPNPSFEEHDGCPVNLFEVWRVNDWFPVNGSADYFNVCATYHNSSIPSNFEGYQDVMSESDQAYVGLATYPPRGVRESFGTELKVKLEIGKKYYVSFYYVGAYYEWNHITCYTNKLGIKFLTDKPNVNYSGLVNLALLDNTASLVINSIITDTVNWTKFSGTFIADSSYQYMVVGNFFSLDSLTYFCINTGDFISYTFIDNFCVSTDATYCASNWFSSSPSTENVIYDYSSGTIRLLNIEPDSNFKFSLYNSIGQLMFLTDSYETNYYIPLAAGVYVATINHRNYKLLIL